MDKIMFLRRLTVAREGHYGYGAVKPDAPLETVVEIEGGNGKVELKLGPDVGKRIVAVIAEELAEESKRVAEAMTADFLTQHAQLGHGDVPDTKVIEA